MNAEQTNTENETYSLFTISWDQLAGCTEMAGQNIVIKSLTPQTLQLLNNGNSGLLPQEIQIYIPEPEHENVNNVVSTNEESPLRENVSSLSAEKAGAESEVRYLKCKSTQENGKRDKRVGKREYPMKCPQCEESFTRLSEYRQHMLDHRNMKKYRCEHCSASYNIEKNFTVHMAMHAKGGPNCPICDRKFQRLASLKSHLMLHQVEETFPCSICLAEYEKEEDLNVHLESHRTIPAEVETEKLPLVCSHCSYLFQDRNKYKEHVTLHIKAKRIVNSNRRFKRRNVNTNRDYAHKCDQCPKSFAKLCLLERHRRIHTGEKPFICEICNRGFSQNGTLQIHLNKHQGKKPFQCVFCEAKFSQKGNLRVHLEKTHTAGSPGEKVYKCIHCTCIFKKVSSLNGHITKVHLASFKEDTTDVAKVIDQLKELGKQTAKLITSDADPVKKSDAKTILPPKVDETFVKIADSSVEGPVRRYVIKQRRYGETRWYICSYCNKEFKKPSDLIRHIRIHTREKPFQCRQCGQTFALKSTLRNHLNTHERPTCECVICLKKFNSIRMLNVHLRRHDRSAIAHKTRSYKCSLCDRTFVSLESAKVHMQVHDLPDTITLGREAPKVDVNMVMKQPMLETENGLFSVAAPKPKTPYATMEQFKNRPFKCHVCDAAFMKNVHLKRHMLMHTGKKDYKCEYCPKSFFTNYALKEHVNYHTKTKNHECKHCKKHFYTNSILQRHLLMHSNQKPYICPYCKKRFKQAQLCRKHIRKTHKRDLNESLVAMTETGELNLEATKILDLTDMLNESEFHSEEDDGSTNANALTPIETYNNISTLENKSLLKESLRTGRKIRRKTILQAMNQERVTKQKTEEESVAKVNVVKPPEPKIEYNPNEMNEVSIENLQDSSISYPTIFISSEDLQLLSNSNVVNSLLPQLKLQNTDPLLLSSINELQDSNILYPMNSTITQEEADYQTVGPSYDTFNPNLIFNSNMNELNLNIQTDKDLELKKEAQNNYTNEQIDLELSQMAAQKVDNAITDNLIIFNNGDTQKNVDMNYYNINFSQNDYIDINTLNLPANTSIGKVMQPEEDNLICSNCQKTFKNIDEINCHVCNAVANSEEIFMKTEDVTAKIGVDPVHVAPETEKTKEVTPSNEEVEEPNTEAFECNFCQKTFSLKTALLRHMSAKHKEMVNRSCSFCVKKFKKRSDLMRHLRTHTGEKPFACDKCEKSFSLKSTLMSHYRTHNPMGTKEFKCQVCNTFFSCKSSLKKHTNIHADAKPFACEICSIKFRTSYHKKCHMLTHEREMKNNNTNKLGKINLLESILLESTNEILAENNKIELREDDVQLQEAAHNLITTELPIAESLVLNEGIQFDPILLQLQNNVYTTLQFGLDGQLQLKQNINEPEAYAIADEQLPEHIMQEETERPAKDKKVQCDLCLKWYVSRSVLSKHKRLLHGRYKCGKCKKAFNTTELLERHSRLHFGYRPFSCSLCANSFSEEASLKIHMKRIHNVDSANTIGNL